MQIHIELVYNDLTVVKSFSYSKKMFHMQIHTARLGTIMQGK